MSSAKKIVLLVGTAAAAAALYYGLNWWEAHRSVPPTVAWGTVDMRTVALMFETSGRIASLAKEEGERVKKGEPLGELDLRALKIERERTAAQLEGLDADWKLALEGYRTEEIDAARAQAEAAESSAKLAQTTLARTQKLYRAHVASDQALDEARSNADNLTKVFAAAQADLARLTAGLRPEEIRAKKAARDAGEAALKALDYQIDVASRIESPVDGVIRSRLLEPGDMASASKRVYEIAVTSPKWVRAYVTETQLGFIKEGAPARITTDTTPAYEATVGYISPEAEFTPKTVQTQDLRTLLVYEVRLTLSDPENKLRLGQPVTVDFAPQAEAQSGFLDLSSKAAP